MLIYVVQTKELFKNWRRILGLGVCQASFEVVWLFGTTLQKEVERLDNEQGNSQKTKMIILWKMMQEKQFNLEKRKLRGKSFQVCGNLLLKITAISYY